MYPLFESIKVVDGQFINLSWHQQRVDRSRDKIGISHKHLNLASSLVIPPEFHQGIAKCRASYGEALGPVVYSKYTRKKISSLRQVDCEPFDYGLKYQDRSKIEQLYQLRGSCDDVLITIDGIITDTTYSNVVLYSGSAWYTPEQPLLPGTQRAKLLSTGEIKMAKIQIAELGDFQKLVLINAMLEFDPMEFMRTEDIRLWQGKPIGFS